MSGIIPTPASGAVETRDINGVCLNPPGIQFFYCPPPSFQSSCAIYYLPDDCQARITAAQINAFQSELLCLAQTINPNGNWNCAQVCNLSQLFQQWRDGTYLNSLGYWVHRHICQSPFDPDISDEPGASLVYCNGAGDVILGPPVGSQVDICASPFDPVLGTEVDTTSVLCDGAGNLFRGNGPNFPVYGNDAVTVLFYAYPP